MSVCVEGLSPPVKKAELDSPSPQEDSPKQSFFTQHHQPVIAVHSGQLCMQNTRLYLSPSRKVGVSVKCVNPILNIVVVFAASVR